MKVMKLDALRLDEAAKNGLTTLRRRTGIETRNVLCRWALCVSLAKDSIPRENLVGEKKELEISWDIFAGKAASVYRALLVERCRKEGLEITRTNLNFVLSQHVHRGIGYLLSSDSSKSIVGLVQIAA
jgi:DNA sulfur modification protein DndE